MMMVGELAQKRMPPFEVMVDELPYYPHKEDLEVILKGMVEKSIEEAHLRDDMVRYRVRFSIVTMPELEVLAGHEDWEDRPVGQYFWHNFRTDLPGFAMPRPMKMVGYRLGAKGRRLFSPIGFGYHLSPILLATDGQPDEVVCQALRLT